MKKEIYFILFILFNLLFGCSPSQETAKEDQKKEPNIYVFDDIEKDHINLPDSLDNKPPVQEVKLEPAKVDSVKKEPIVPSTKFIIQLGAFTTKERALLFIDENKSKINSKMNIVFRDKIKLFSVQIPAGDTKEEAEKIRNSIWQIPAFKDAFILAQD